MILRFIACNVPIVVDRCLGRMSRPCPAVVVADRQQTAGTPWNPVVVFRSCMIRNSQVLLLRATESCKITFGTSSSPPHRRAIDFDRITTRPVRMPMTNITFPPSPALGKLEKNYVAFFRVIGKILSYESTAPA